MSYKTMLEMLVVILLAILVLCVFTVGSSKADCFPCFEDTRYEQKVTKKTSKKQKTVRTEFTGSGSRGIASYYWQPQAVACGGRFNPHAMTAAHRTFPCGSRVRVTASNGRSVVVTINDRGPFVKGRIIDLSLAAARQIGMTKSGLTTVTIERI
jgi:rare lipoprotein A